MARPAPTRLLHFETSFASQREAVRVGRALLRDRLVACVQTVPMASEYWWKGRMVREREVLLMGKTTSRHKGAVNRRVRALHPYEVPYLAWIPLTGVNPAYASWVRDETRARDPKRARRKR